MCIVMPILVFNLTLIFPSFFPLFSGAKIGLAHVDNVRLKSWQSLGHHFGLFAKPCHRYMWQFEKFSNNRRNKPACQQTVRVPRQLIINPSVIFVIHSPSPNFWHRHFSLPLFFPSGICAVITFNFPSVCSDVFQDGQCVCQAGARLQNKPTGTAEGKNLDPSCPIRWNTGHAAEMEVARTTHEWRWTHMSRLTSGGISSPIFTCCKRSSAPLLWFERHGVFCVCAVIACHSGFCDWFCPPVPRGWDVTNSLKQSTYSCLVFRKWLRKVIADIYIF